MCGQGGFQLRAGGAQEMVARRMCDGLSHRGPDDAGVFVAGATALAHTRLSIVDPSPAGHQPYLVGSGALAYNGEIYNAPSLRRELQGRGVEFEGHSDTEVLARLIVADGLDEALRRIEGMFAFAWYDGTTGMVSLCRDALGIKPCHWVEKPEGTYWASVVTGLRAVTDVRPHPVRTLGALLGRGETSPSGTAFDGVEQVPPGGIVEIRGGQVVGHRSHRKLTDWVDPDYLTELDDLSFEAAATEFERLLDESVDRVLLSDVPLGTFASGGVDSSLVATVASRTDPDHRLFTADVVGRHSEAANAAELATTLGLPITSAPFEPDDLLADWAVATLHHEAPIVTHVNSLPFRRLALAAATEGVKPVLTGEGADELFLGYPPLAFGRYARVLGAPLRGMLAAYRRVPKLYEKAFPELDQRQPTFLSSLTDDLASARSLRSAEEAFSFLPPAAAAQHAVTLEHVSRHLLTLLHRNDRMGMAAGVEARFPFLDERLVRFGINLPYRFKIRTAPRLHDRKHPFQIDKGIVRAAASRALPASVAYRRKDGFPMYGHLNVKVGASAFDGGYVADLAGLTATGLDEMARTTDPYYLAKLTSIEVFGRLFAWDQTPDEVTQHLRRHVTLAV